MAKLLDWNVFQKGFNNVVLKHQSVKQSTLKVVCGEKHRTSTSVYALKIKINKQFSVKQFFLRKHSSLSQTATYVSIIT